MAGDLPGPPEARMITNDQLEGRNNGNFGTYKKIPSFSGSTVLNRSLDELIRVSSGSIFSLDAKNIDYNNKRGEIIVSLHDLENCIREFIADSTLFSATSEDIRKLFISLGKYLLDLISEAEWVSLSKGFSSVCLSVVKSIPSDFHPAIIQAYVSSIENDQERSLHRKFSDLYSLVTHGMMQSHSGFEALNAMIKFLFQLPIDSESLPSELHNICESPNFYKCKLLSFKVFNVLIYPNNPDVPSNLDLEGLKGLFVRLYKLINDIKCDRDILSNLGIALIGIVYTASRCDGTELDAERLFYRLTNTTNLSVNTFEQDKWQDLEDVEPEKFFSEEVLFSFFTSLQPLSFVYSIRGILKYLNYSYGTDIVCKNNEHMERVTSPSDILYSAYKIFKIAATEFVRVDVNYAALQGLQLFITFVTSESFGSDPFKKCLLDLPDIVLNFWSSRIRRSSHLSICIWKRFLEILHSIKDGENGSLVSDYIDHIFIKSINYFGGNLKLKYFALQYLLKFSGPCEVLKKEPFIIPHLFCSLSNLSTKASSLSLLTELLLSIYRTFKLYDSKNGTDVAYISFKCFVYSVVIAILNFKRLHVLESDGSKLVPQKSATHTDLETRANLLAESFKTIFSKIDKNCTFELLKLSACFSLSDFYPYLAEGEKKMLENSKDYTISDNRNLESFFYNTLAARRDKDVDVGDEKILHLTGPLKFSESICLYNFRMLDRIEFVDFSKDTDLKMKGILIFPLVSPPKFLLEKLRQGEHEGVFYISIERFYTGLSHVNDDLRLNLFKTLVCLPKTTKHAHVIEIHLVLFACKSFMKTTLPSLRQNFLEAIKPFIIRFYTILASNVEKLQNLVQNLSGNLQELEKYLLYLNPDLDVEAIDGLIFHFLFISILLKQMIATIHPCSSDFKNTIALEIILMIYKIFCGTETQLPSLIGLFDSDIVVPLFYSLFYLSTKQQELIFQIMKYTPSFPSHSEIMDYVTAKSISSLWSVRTLRYCSGSRALTILINLAVNGCEDDNLKHFTNLLFSNDIAHFGDKGISVHYLDYLLGELDCYCNSIDEKFSSKFSNAVSPVGLLSLISQFIDSISLTLTKDFEIIQLSETLFDKLEKISEYILKYVGYTVFGQDDQEIKIDCRGHLALSGNSGSLQNINVAEEPTIDCKLCLSKCSIANRDITPRFLDQDDFKTRPFTVLCWKTIHEVCNCLKSLLELILSQTAHVSHMSEERDINVKTGTYKFYKIVDKMGKFILLSLLRSRHLGCTDSFSDILTWLSKKLMVCKLHQILNNWIDILLSLLKGTSISYYFDTDVPDLLCDSHRRSEPLALTFTSILRAETDRHQPILVPNVTKTLLELSGSDHIVTASDYFSEVDVRIHTLNILRAIYKCSELRAINYLNCVSTLNVSLKNMRHDNWSVRNSSALLFASVLQHITGNDINDTTSDTFTKIRDSICSDEDFYKQINLVLDLLKLSNESSLQESDTIFPISKYASIYQGSAFVLNLLTRIAICSFVSDECGHLYNNVKFALTCDNACIRLMAANILSRNYFEISAANLVNMVFAASLDICKNLNDSNYVNGSLLLIQESIGMITENGLGYMFLNSPVKEDIYSSISSMSSVLESNSYDTLQSMDCNSALICSLYLVCVTAKCFENFIQAIRTIELLCYSIRSLDSFSSETKNMDSSARTYVVNCSVILALLSSRVLGDGTFNLVLSIFSDNIRSKVAEIPVENKNLTRLQFLFPRIGEDEMPRIKCADILVNSFLVLFTLSSYEFPIVSTSVPKALEGESNYDAFVDFLCLLLIGDLNHKVLKNMVQSIRNSIIEKLLGSSLEAIRKLWVTVSGLLSSDDSDFNYITLLGIHNKIVARMRREVDVSAFFDEAWFRVMSKVVSRNISNNFDLFLEVFKTCHMYSLIGSVERKKYKCNILGVASGLIFRAVHPSSELLLRLHLSQFLSCVGIPIFGETSSLDSSSLEEYNNYCLHLYASLLFLLQDDNNSVRTNASVCCSKAMNKFGEEWHPIACIKEWISFVSRTFPVDKMLLFLEQFAFVDNVVYRPIKYDIEQFGKHMLVTGKTELTLANAKSLAEDVNLFKLAEMDCIFHKEPYNMYMEHLVFMTSIDRVLCGLMRENVSDREWCCKVGEFSAKTARKCLNSLREHVYDNYYRANVDSDLESIKHSISLDSIVVYCCVAGFSRSCLSILTLGVNAKPESWNALKVFGRTSGAMNQFWCRRVQDILKKFEDAQYNLELQFVDLITSLEQFLDYF